MQKTLCRQVVLLCPKECPKSPRKLSVRHLLNAGKDSRLLHYDDTYENSLVRMSLDVGRKCPPIRLWWHFSAGSLMMKHYQSLHSIPMQRPKKKCIKLLLWAKTASFTPK